MASAQENQEQQQQQQEEEDIGGRIIDNGNCFSLAVAKIAALMTAGSLRVPESIRRDMVASMHESGDSADAVEESKCLDHLSESVAQSPAAFLRTYGHYLGHAELAGFEHLQLSNYQVLLLLKKLRAGDTKRNDTVKRNRRFAVMGRLEKDGFFGMDEIKERDPRMYYEFVGQYDRQAVQRGYESRPM